MTNQVISLVEALKPRACKVAEAIVARMTDAGLWAGYRAYEGMVGELRLVDLLTFHRPREPHAVLVFRNPRMIGAREVKWGEPVILEANIDQRFSSSIHIDQPIKYDKGLEHTFSVTRSLQEQIKAGLEASIKAGVEAGSQGGIHGITAKVYAEIALKLYAEYQRQWGTVKFTSDTIKDAFERIVTQEELDANGPVVINYTANRSMNREQRPVRADCDYEHSVELIDETDAGENPPRIQEIVESWAEMRNVMQGFAPRDRLIERDGRKVPVSTGFYEEFLRSPVRGDALEDLSAPAKGAIELLIEYDNVLSQDIKIV